MINGSMLVLALLLLRGFGVQFLDFVRLRIVLLVSNYEFLVVKLLLSQHMRPNLDDRGMNVLSSFRISLYSGNPFQYMDPSSLLEISIPNYISVFLEKTRF